MMTLKSAMWACQCGRAILLRLIHSGAIEAHRGPANGGAAGWWYIDTPLDELRAIVADAIEQRPLDVPKVVYHLSDEDCWSQGSASFMSEGYVTMRGFQTVIGDRYYCPKNRDHKLTWNGFAYYCDECDPNVAVVPEASVTKEVVTRLEFPANRYDVGVDDPYYERETTYYRTPAAKNYPRGRNDPKIDKTAEGFVRPSSLGWSRNHRMRYSALKRS